MNLVEFDCVKQLIIVKVNHKVYAAPASLVSGYGEDFFECASCEALEEVGFEFTYGLNAY